jgi:hypothetical protein
MNARQRKGVHIPTMARLEKIILETPRPEDLPWEEAVRRAAPQTPATGRAWGAERVFEAESFVAGKTEVHLIHFGSGQHEYHDLAAYAEDNHLTAAHPRQCLAIAEQHPRLRAKLGYGERDFCSIGSPTVFPPLAGTSQGLIFHVLIDQKDERIAELTDMWRRTYFWEWFAFIPRAGHLHAVA